MGLSERQQDIISKMQNGWELGEDCGLDYYGRIQKGGLGKGGEVITVSISTITALERKGFIKMKSDRYATRVYELAETTKGG